MAVYKIYTLEESNITISGGKQLSGITTGDGTHLIGEAITLKNKNWVVVEINDDESNFEDNESYQPINKTTTYDGTTYPEGVRAESEYGLTVQDPSGNTYTLIGFNINEPVNDPGIPSYATVEGLAFVGGVGEFPPIGVPLTVVSTSEGPSNPYSSLASPPCFTRGCLIETPDGMIAIEALSVGGIVLTKDHGYQRIRWIGRRQYSAEQLESNPKLQPVRITSGALGNGLPKRDMLVSRQHRMLVQSKIAERMFGKAEVLISAIKLTKLPGIFVDETVQSVEYIHLLFDQHEIIYAEGAPTESLFVGLEALKSISPEARQEIFSIFPEVQNMDYRAKPVRFIPHGKNQKQLMDRHLKNRMTCISAEDTQPPQST